MLKYPANAVVINVKMDVLAPSNLIVAQPTVTASTDLIVNMAVRHRCTCIRCHTGRLHKNKCKDKLARQSIKEYKEYKKMT